jgi:xanthine dehydrogenase molybdopterin-binding subunit B
MADACEAASQGAGARLHAPATPEAILKAVQGW